MQAAIALLETGEYDAIQMRDVAERAAVALATIYRYFTSKEHLYAAAMLEWASGYPSTGRAGSVAGGSDEARLRALMRRAVRAFERYPQMMRAEIVLESSNDPNARALWDEFAAHNTATLTAAMSSTDPEHGDRDRRRRQRVMVTRLRSWALGRCTIRDVDRSVSGPST